ncbi:ABC transporter permease [Metabacillus iocasae]|uniref:Spermidine/putrescine transport system permease protein n=1 Tax=Priestia iocasae TaxID=2291674 RepID=A0ABS2QSJ0_9BACI|nr:ABC transporter permease subunit [Metabacillus iocasae]MBM7702430.1 putative spermidine/putrescine transport system permease protein [Metabacillus iocasae]
MKKKGLLLIWGLTVVFPMLVLGLKSISQTWRWPDLIPTSFTLRGWQQTFQDPQLLSSLQTSILLCGLVVVLNGLLAFPAAKVLAFQSFKGKAWIETTLTLPILVPILFVVMGIHLTFIRLGFIETMTGLVLVHLLPTLPYSIRILRTGFERMGEKWEQQAQTLGASRVQRFLLVTLPFLLPSIRSMVTLTVVIALSQYALTVIIGGGFITTLPVLYYPYFQSVNEAVMASFSLLFALLPLFFLGIIEALHRLYDAYVRSR